MQSTIKREQWQDRVWARLPLDVQAAGYAVRQRAKVENDYPLNRLERWFYTLKVLVCLLFNWRADLWLVERVTVAEFNVEEWGSMEWGRMVEWDMLVVAHGLRNWRMCILHDGTP